LLGTTLSLLTGRLSGAGRFALVEFVEAICIDSLAAASCGDEKGSAADGTTGSQISQRRKCHRGR